MSNKSSALPESIFDETENITKEYLDRFTLALETEKKKLREHAEQDSNQILDKAREEANRIIEQAKRDAEEESENLRAKLEVETERILRDANEKAFAEAQRESARIISETREKTAKIVRELIESDIKQAENWFIEAASKARSELEIEKSELLNVTQSIEDIINETEKNIWDKVEKLAGVITATEEKLQAVKEFSLDESGAGSLQITEEATKNETSEQVENQETENANEEESKIKSEEDETATVDSAEPVAEYEEGTDTRNERAALPLTVTGIKLQQGIALLEADRVEEALAAFDMVLKHDPQNALAWRKKGAAYGKLGRHEKALEMLEKSIECNSNDYITWHNKIAALHNLGKKEEAEEAKKVEKRLKKQK